MTQDKTYRVGMIGVGRKGHGHARGYEGNPRTEVVSAADPDESNLAIFLDRYPVKGYSDYREMLAAEDLDIAAPILPVRYNPQVVIDCAGAGVKAVYCEKPMAASLAQADAMVEECRSRGVWFAAGDAYRNMAPHWKVLDYIKSGGLGEVGSINLYLSTVPISGGGCQGLSVMRLFAFDAAVDWVTGWVAGDPHSDGDQNMGGMVRFANGIDAFIHNKPAGKKGIEVVCSEGVYYSEWGNGHIWKIEEGRLEEIAGFFDEFGGTEGWMEPSGTRQRYGIQAIVDSIDKGVETLCSGENMGKVLEIGIALRESHRRGHAPVKLPLEDRSLEVVPVPRRMENKKETLGEAEYAKQIGSSSTKPVGGAMVQ